MKQTDFLKETNPVVILEVKAFGTMRIELFPEVAPNTVKHMMALIDNAYFDGLEFHRIIKGFMIQGGASKEPVDTIRGEFDANRSKNLLSHGRGVISMARTSDPNSASSQFFIVHQDAPHLDGQYAGFGCVTEGFDVLDAIATLQTSSSDYPVEKVVIDAMRIEK